MASAVHRRGSAEVALIEREREVAQRGRTGASKAAVRGGEGQSVGYIPGGDRGSKSSRSAAGGPLSRFDADTPAGPSDETAGGDSERGSGVAEPAGTDAPRVERGRQTDRQTDRQAACEEAVAQLGSRVDAMCSRFDEIAAALDAHQQAAADGLAVVSGRCDGLARALSRREGDGTGGVVLGAMACS